MVNRFDVDGYTAAWNSRQPERVLEYLADDVTLVTPDVPEGAHGKEQLREIVADWFRMFNDLRIQPEQTVVQEDRVAMLVRAQGTNTGDVEISPGNRLPATGKRVDYRIGTFLTLDREGKVQRTTAVFDNLGIMEQLGATGMMAGQAPGRGAPQTSR